MHHCYCWVTWFSVVISVLIDQVPLLASSVVDYLVLNSRVITDWPYIAILSSIQKCTLNNRRNENRCHTSCRLSVFSFSEVDCCQSSAEIETTQWITHYSTVAAILLKNAPSPFCVRHQPVLHHVNIFPLTVRYFIGRVGRPLYSVWVFGALFRKLRTSIDTKVLLTRYAVRCT